MKTQGRNHNVKSPAIWWMTQVRKVTAAEESQSSPALSLTLLMPPLSHPLALPAIYSAGHCADPTTPIHTWNTYYHPSSRWDNWGSQKVNRLFSGSGHKHRANCSTAHHPSTSSLLSQLTNFNTEDTLIPETPRAHLFKTQLKVHSFY